MNNFSRDVAINPWSIRRIKHSATEHNEEAVAM